MVKTSIYLNLDLWWLMLKLEEQFMHKKMIQESLSLENF